MVSAPLGGRFLRVSGLASLLLLAACQTVQDSKIELDKDFERFSTSYQLKRPVLQLTDKAFQQQLGLFSISSAEVSWQQSTTVSAGLVRSDSSAEEKQYEWLLNSILDDLTDNHSDLVRQLEQSGKRDFAFDVSSAGQVLVRSQCRIMYVNALTEFHDTEQADRVVSADQTRERSYLGCSLTSARDNWQLVLETRGDAPARMLLRTDNQSYDISTVTKRLELINNQWIPGPDWNTQISGVVISAEQLQRAALAFDGQTPRLWVYQQATDSEHALLIAAGYSILMYDWLDNEWRRN